MHSAAVPNGPYTLVNHYNRFKVYATPNSVVYMRTLQQYKYDIKYLHSL